MVAYLGSDGKIRNKEQQEQLRAKLKSGVAYWLQDPISLRTVGPFFEKFPRVPEYEGWNVYGFTPDIVGTVIVENTDGE